MPDQAHIDALLIRSFATELDAAEQATLDAWLNATEQNVQIAQQLRDAWDKAAFEKPFVADAAAGLAAVRIKAGLPAVGKPMENDSASKRQAAIIEMPNETPYMRTNAFQWVRYAAAVAAVLIIASALWFQKGLFFKDTNWQVAENNSSEKQEITLPDGSHVWLKKGAQLRYPATFAAGKRAVYLRGTAFFSVTHNPAQVFEVNSNSAERVTVLGTAFEVQFNENQPECSVQVQQGKVRFEGTSEKNMLLTAGQKAVFNRQSAQMRAVQADANALFWQNGMLVFDRTPLKAVFAQIEQLYHVKINVKNQEIGDCLLSAIFPQPDAAALLRSIAQLYQMQFSEIGDNAYQLEGGICTE